MYTLSDAPPSLEIDASSPLVAVADVKLPGYAAGRAMVRAGAGSTISTLEEAQWSDDLSILVTEALARQLRSRGINAWTLPVPAGLRADYTVSVTFHSFLWDDSAGLALPCDLLISSGGRVSVSTSLTAFAATSTDDASQLATAASTGVARIAEQISEQLALVLQ
ncbi:MAG: ABC-type transport auxiliary lipoprotein family protein [Pseudomonadota bacterium]